MTTGKTVALTRQTFVGKVMSLLFNILSRFVIAFLPRSKRLLISWLLSPSALILEPPQNKGFYYLNHNLLGLWSHYLNDGFLRETLLEKHFGFGDPQGASVSLSANWGRGLSDSSHLWHRQVLHCNPTGVAGHSVWLGALWEGGFLLIWGPPQAGLFLSSWIRSPLSPLPFTAPPIPGRVQCHLIKRPKKELDLGRRKLVSTQCLFQPWDFPVRAKLLQSCRLFVTPWTVAYQALCPWYFPGKKAGVGSPSLLQGIFPTEGPNPCLLHLLHWPVGSLPLSHLGSLCFLVGGDN